MLILGSKKPFSPHLIFLILHSFILRLPFLEVFREDIDLSALKFYCPWNWQFFLSAGLEFGTLKMTIDSLKLFEEFSLANSFYFCYHFMKFVGTLSSDCRFFIGASLAISCFLPISWTYFYTLFLC